MEDTRELGAGGGRGGGDVRDGSSETGSAGDGQASVLHFTEEETEGQGGPEAVPCDPGLNPSRGFQPAFLTTAPPPPTLPGSLT